MTVAYRVVSGRHVESIDAAGMLGFHSGGSGSIAGAGCEYSRHSKGRWRRSCFCAMLAFQDLATVAFVLRSWLGFTSN